MSTISREAALQNIDDMPPCDETQSRIERVLSGKTPEEQYDILYWLMMEYGKGHSNSMLARIEWLKGEKGGQDDRT